MKKTINIDGKKVEFKASAATLRIYRNMFNRDALVDMAKLGEETKKNKNNGGLSISSLVVFENIAYVMAYQAAKDSNQELPDSPEEWLDEFETFSVYEILPQLLELWNMNTATLSTPKKK